MQPFVDHPDRRLAQTEIHARPIAPIRPPARIRRVAFLFGQDGAAGRSVRSRLEQFCAANNLAAPARDERRFDFATPERAVTWEYHTEFATVTWAAAGQDQDPWPADIGLSAADGVPVALAVRVDLMATEAITASALAGFDERSMCYGAVEQGRAEVATDFIADGVGYTRYEIAAGSLGPYAAGALVRRLLEIETYRVLALVGIGLARMEAPRLAQLEERLAATLHGIGNVMPESASLLDGMYALQVEASQSVERTRYRFAASQAYGAILMQRLRDLDERDHGEHWTLNGYLRQRAEPALATFVAIERRQSALLDQAARATALLGTRISLDIDTQNRSILSTISETAEGQFRLQRTVEGLSTIAITYYLLGIVGYALHGIALPYEHEKAIGIAILAPVALVAVWFYLRRTARH